RSRNRAPRRRDTRCHGRSHIAEPTHPLTRLHSIMVDGALRLCFTLVCLLHLSTPLRSVHRRGTRAINKTGIAMPPDKADSLNILHVLRAPVGGLFRHVRDLARGQVARGHRVGLIADSSTGGVEAEAALAALARELAHGLTRVPMSRHIGVGD